MSAHHIPDASALSTWRKSSHSGGDNGSCVEVADGHPNLTPIRDSKNPTGPALLFGPTAWSAFVTGVKG
ncbi:DUF397 domain-containing protein [Streptomyces sp. S.PB5]|uniref:DUF397 domain-containing protein n=1 Tax=Streptomyces sp. S.PB5 TaxID=3020844 RepID=UPI0025B13E8E|nr:DUF397 domain-containing protein [Streptomyces sp. S.PB5]MDN3023607.1 DUF397 domain-containing protein [Streptomyces sp. S.PB5]